MAGTGGGDSHIAGRAMSQQGVGVEHCLVGEQMPDPSGRVPAAGVHDDDLRGLRYLGDQ